jgi:hypothetical protein
MRTGSAVKNSLRTILARTSTTFDCGFLSLESFGQDAVRVSVFARQLADIGVVQSFEATAVHDHFAIGLNRSLENDSVDVNALFLMTSAKAPVDGTGMVRPMVSALTSKRRYFGIMPQAYLTKLTNISQILFYDTAKHVGFLAPFYGHNPTFLYLAGYRLLVG